MKYQSKIPYTDFTFIRGIGMESIVWAVESGLLKVVS